MKPSGAHGEDYIAREGWLLKQNAKRPKGPWKWRYFSLHSNIVSFSDVSPDGSDPPSITPSGIPVDDDDEAHKSGTPDSSTGLSEILGEFELLDTSRVEKQDSPSNRQPFPFLVTLSADTGGKEYRLCALSSDDRTAWMLALAWEVFVVSIRGSEPDISLARERATDLLTLCTSAGPDAEDTAVAVHIGLSKVLLRAKREEEAGALLIQALMKLEAQERKGQSRFGEKQATIRLLKHAGIEATSSSDAKKIGGGALPGMVGGTDAVKKDAVKGGESGGGGGGCILM